MRLSKIMLAALVAFATTTGWAQNKGGIDAEMLGKLRDSYKHTPEEKALRNALAGTDIQKLAANADVTTEVDAYFSHRVPTKGITDQQSSGRCWLFSGMNVLRAKMMAEYDLPECEFSQVYCFFYDQLEKANLFLQGVVDTRHLPMDDKMVEWLFKNPLSDGGQFTGVADIIGKYGLVPREVMNETYSANNTARIAFLIKLKLILL